MNVGGLLDQMDKDYHHRDHRPFGWVFCDLLDYYYGMSARALLRERRHKSGLWPIPILVPALLITKPFRIKWDFSAGRRRQQDPQYDWADDPNLNYEETMAIVDALPDADTPADKTPGTTESLE